MQREAGVGGAQRTCDGGGKDAPRDESQNAHDANSWPSSLRVNGVEVTSFTYDNDGLITASGPLTITRNPTSGDVGATALGALTTTESTNAFGELTSYVSAYGGSALYSEQIMLRDLEGRIVDRTETVLGMSSTYHYVYDRAGRLTDVSVNGTLQSHYVYDDNGNRSSTTLSGTTLTGTYDVQDRLTNYGNDQYTYSAVGSLQAKLDSTSGATTTYDYDSFGNLRSVQLPDGRHIQYEIDASNRRVGKSVNGARTLGLLYSGRLTPVAQVAADNTVVSTFVYATRTNVPDYMRKGADVNRFVVDHLGSVRMVVNVADGSVAQRLVYDEFGNVLNDTNPGFQPFGFAGGLYDVDTRLVRFSARDYDAVTGRWTAKDPIGFAGGTTNLYEYVANDPINKIDPEGLFVPVLLGICAFGGCEAAATAALWGAALLTAGLAGGATAELINYAKDGTPGNNQAQNKQFADAVRAAGKAIGRALTVDEIRRLHDEISGQDLGFHDIVEAAKDLCGGD